MPSAATACSLSPFAVLPSPVAHHASPSVPTIQPPDPGSSTWAWLSRRPKEAEIAARIGLRTRWTHEWTQCRRDAEPEADEVPETPPPGSTIVISSDDEPALQRLPLPYIVFSMQP
ncbi:unnamed protein product [Rhizoctonia solani]|uniref:Uncharacterized protein n=1 Tax=Rhizoctonia solani TaxID=456999 RepID=A0A8H3I036_9AGAM|nr:unnamed protein product [Rhizoctonia solani]